MKNKPEHRYIRINEDLTKTRNAIAYRARQLRSQTYIKDTWAVDGKIFVKDTQDQMHVTNTMSSLHHVISSYCRPGASDFIARIDRDGGNGRNPVADIDRRTKTYAEATAPTANSTDPR